MDNATSFQDSFFQAGGSLDPEAPSYIVREADEELWGLILSGEYCNVLTARQMGKSSLILRAKRRLQKQEVRSVFIDLTTVGSEQVTAEEWYYTLISEISRRLGLELDEHDWWVARSLLSPVQRFTEFLRQVVLVHVSGRLVIFVDEIDSTLALSFTDDFFIAIRSMFNERAGNPAYKRLSFVLVGVARPQDLIKNRKLTPYNIGRNVDLKDFSAQNATLLRPGLDARYPEQAEHILERILYWTAGHPYLTQRLCFEVIRHGGEEWPEERIDRLVEQMFFREGQIRAEIHLLWIDEFVRDSEDRREMLRIYRDVLAGRQIEDEERSVAKSKLKLSGLVKATPSRYLQVRNPIYERVFGPGWVEISQSETSAVQPAGPEVPDGRIDEAPLRGKEETVPQKRERKPGVQPWMLAIGALLVVIALVIAGIALASHVRPMPTPLPTETQAQIAQLTRTLTGTALPASTETPTITPSPIADRTATPTSKVSDTPTPTLTATSTPSPTNTATLPPTPTQTLEPTPTPIPVATPYVVVNGEVIRVRSGPGQAYEIVGWAQRGDAFPLLARVAEGTWWQIGYRGGMAWVIDALVDVHSEDQEIPVAPEIPPTPTLTPTLTLTPSPTPLPPPVLVEPENGERFPYRTTIRFKFTWVRRLKGHEKVSIYVRAVDGSGEFDWWAGEADILGGGGSIRPINGVYQFEINSGMGGLAPGDAIWRVAIFEDVPPDKPRISPWSEERLLSTVRP
ncbi:MAG: AAA-like domain-containing protein [Anaerolineae bacterium]|nr:AAA-like domain-containing protein [Anaerolineae bacterium]